MKFNLIETKEILDLEKEIGFELVVNERPKSDTVSKYYVAFEGGEVMQGGCLLGSFGNGNTIDEAIRNYCLEVETKRMAFGGYTDDRKEVVIPKLVHTKLLGK